jgi:hypothetical protein
MSEQLVTAGTALGGLVLVFLARDLPGARLVLQHPPLGGQHDDDGDACEHPQSSVMRAP